MEGQVTDLRSLKNTNMYSYKFPSDAALVTPVKLPYAHFHLPPSKWESQNMASPVPLDVRFSPADGI